MKTFSFIAIAFSFFLVTNTALAVTISCSTGGEEYTLSIDEKNSCMVMSSPGHLTARWDYISRPKCFSDTTKVVFTSTSQAWNEQENDWFRFEQKITIDRSNGTLGRQFWFYYSGNSKGTPETDSGTCKKITGDQF